MKNPEYLTKDQLKEELLANGVELPSGKVLKAEYVTLYNRYINVSDKVVNTSKKSSKKSSKPFSSEVLITDVTKKKNRNERVAEKEEANEKIKQVFIQLTKDDQQNALAKCRKARSQDSKKGKKVLTNYKEAKRYSDLEDLTNAEISARLRSLKQTVGPITATTRKLYLEKLAKLESGDAVNNHEQFEEDVEIVELDEAPVTRSRRRTMLFTQNTKATTRKALRETQQTRSRVNVTYEEEEEVDVEEPIQVGENQNTTDVDDHSPSTSSTVPDQSSTSKPNKPERRWSPIWLQIVFTFLVVLFAYLVWRAMEKNPAPLSLPKSKGSQ